VQRPPSFGRFGLGEAFRGNFGLFKGYLINLLGRVLGKHLVGGAVKLWRKLRQESGFGL